MVGEEYWRKGRKVYAAFMNLKKAYDRVDRETVECAESPLRGRTSTGRNKGLFNEEQVHV